MSGELFPLRSVPDLPVPQNLIAGEGPVKYDRVGRLKTIPKCDDCMMVALEANRAGAAAPLARSARFRRVQGATKVFVCGEHKQHRETMEAQLPRSA